jgi:hypothetical protein
MGVVVGCLTDIVHYSWARPASPMVFFNVRYCGIACGWSCVPDKVVVVARCLRGFLHYSQIHRDNMMTETEMV